ncbi:hypothetical protein [Streptomyces sp. 4F14]|uniref:hypothetical protein n=1 Tax=Streptomyces sp. 4F14 TaxID=3394380 RepID=UPI003A8AF9D2
MTIYSQHATRGKTQILATYQNSGGVVSKTVTSLSDAHPAAPIVDALNRISAFATVPVSIHDEREGAADYYPSKHVAALTDDAVRAGLLRGDHSLWYEYVCLRLHRALADLESLLVPLPDTVSRAIRAELEVEEHDLRAELADFTGTSAEGDPEAERRWEFGHPFVKLDDGLATLEGGTRERLDRREEGITARERAEAISRLRVLVTAHAHSTGMWISLDDPSGQLFAEPYDSDGFYLTVQAPEPGDSDSPWEVEVGRWEPDDPDEEYGEHTSATGNSMVLCALPAAPETHEIVQVLKAVDEKPLLLAQWAAAPVGSALEGTTWGVTERFDS